MDLFCFVFKLFDITMDTYRWIMDAYRYLNWFFVLLSEFDIYWIMRVVNGVLDRVIDGERCCRLAK